MSLSLYILIVNKAHEVWEFIRLKTEIELSDAEIEYLGVNFPNEYNFIADGGQYAHTLKLITRMRSAVKSYTKSTLVLESDCQYRFDGIVPGTYGQGDTVIQFVFKKSNVYCAKIGKKRTISRASWHGNRSASSCVKSCTANSHSGKSPAAIASNMSRRWKS